MSAASEVIDEYCSLKGVDRKEIVHLEALVELIFKKIEDGFVMGTVNGTCADPGKPLVGGVFSDGKWTKA